MASKLLTGIVLSASMFLTAPVLAGGAGQSASAKQQANDAAWQQARVGRGNAPARVVSRPVLSQKALSKKALAAIAEAKDSILNYKKGKNDEKGDTPPLELVPLEKGVRLKVPKGHEPDYDNYSNPGKHTIYEISGVPADGKVSFTALMPASGHVNEYDRASGKRLSKNDTARLYAKSNVYNIEVEHPDGVVEHIDGIKADGQLVKAHDLGITLQPGKTIVRFYPIGSAGVAGYYNGRVVELRWDGNAKPAQQTAEPAAAPAAQ